MTVSSTSYSTTVTGNGSTTTFTYSFPVYDPSTLTLSYTDLSGNVTALSSGLWSVTGVGFGNSGGTFTYPLTGSPIPEGSMLTLTRLVPITQQLSLPPTGLAYPPAVEAAFDQLVMALIQIQGQSVSIAALTAYFSTLPTTEPAIAGQLWLNGGVLCVTTP